MENIKIRKSNIELLRIILMLMILSLHYNFENIGGAFSVLTKNSTNYYIQYFLESAFAISVNCFILITGYFNINENKFKIRKVIDLVVLVLVYNVGLYLIAVLLKIKTFSIYNLLLFAVKPKWFIVIYIALYCISPFINVIIKFINKSSYKLLLIITIFLFSLYPSIVNNANLTTTNEKGYGVIHFVLLYLIGGYIRKHYIDNKPKKSYFIMYILLTLIVFVISLFTKKIWDYNNIVLLMSSIMFFLMFLKVDIQSRSINYISKSLLAVFIIHTDSALMPKVWSLFRIKELCTGNLLIPNEIITIICVFSICLTIDIVRRIVFKYSIDRILNKIRFANLTYEIY